MKKVNTFLIIAILLIIWIDYVPYKLPSIVDNPVKFEFLIYSLCLAYLASYIFHYINVYLPKKRNSKAIRRVIHNNVINIITLRKKLLSLMSSTISDKNELANNSKINEDEYFTKFHKELHYNLDMILTIKERLPTELLNYTLLLKRHPYFKNKLSNLEKLENYVNSYNLLSHKLYLEYKKL